ncbi:MAG: glycoside hydrolase family 9 protein [Bacteroidales bacterium]|nr:glycoside hydrolase family 9 protein [Bacteroidales bacterium]
MKRKLTLAISLLFSAYFSIGQTFTTGDYQKALWMTTRFYGAQRSSAKDHSVPNWLVMDHDVGYDFDKDADGSVDLTGGWFDCGDHVKFGQTAFYSAYILIKGYSEFPEGYDDYYSYDYSGYRAAKDFTWEGKKGKPNGIPDILDEVRAACEWFIKCTPNASTFYSQVGDGNADHQQWVTSVKMAKSSKSQGGQSDGSRVVTKNPADGSMPSFCAATLAIMSTAYAPFDPDFAKKCLDHAKYALAYAKSNLGKTAGAGSFYPANARMYDDYVCANAELYWATNDATYKTEALKYKGEVKDHNWQFGYNNNDDIAAYNLAKLGDNDGLALLEKFIKNIYVGKADGSGIYKSSDNWGTLRYNGNAAFIMALYNKLKGVTTYDKYIYANIDFIMGNNSSKLSYIVGFVPSSGSYTYFNHPHHRNVYLDDSNPSGKNLNIPTRNVQFGFLGGGKGYDPTTLKNAGTADYEITEGGIDYNAGLVSALGYIVSKKAPINPNKFGHPSPDLGPEQTLCGTGKATINAVVDLTALESGEKITYKWYKGETLLSANNGKTSITVTEAGTYTCVVEETAKDKWTTKGSVVVSATLPDVTIGKDVALCKETSATFSTDVEGDGLTYTWYKDNKAISGATTNSYTAYTAGVYKLTISAAGCASKSASATVTSNLPEVINDTICSAGKAELSVKTAGDYEWYSVAEGGTALATGTTYAPNITKTTTYYVQDAGSMSFTAGPKTTDFNGKTAVNWGEISAKFTAGTAMQIIGIDVYIQSAYSTGNQTFTATIEGDAKTTATTTANVSGTGWLTLSFEKNPITLTKAGNYQLNIKPSNAAVGFYENGVNYSSFQGDQSIIKFTGATNGQASNFAFPALCNWKISSGSSCARTPVFAIIDPNADCGGDTEAPTAPGTITVSNITETSATISWVKSTDNTAVTGYNVFVNGTKVGTATTNTYELTKLTANTEYTITVSAFDEAENVSDLSAEKSFSTLQATTKQTIALTVGWNLISFYALPENASVENVFGTNINNIAIIKNDNGFYKPGKAENLQSLTELKYGEGYLVKVTKAFSLAVEGIAPTSTTISLKAGWNLLGYPKATEATASTVLSKYTELKDLKSAQTKLTPGKGYYIKMTSDATITIK